MSFPNIPDVNPDINLKLEDAVNLLLASIALEETSLSELMDAETKKLLTVIEKCKNNDLFLQDAIGINKSVDQTIKNMIKLQMLLQFKLENVMELIPATTTTSTTTTTFTTTTTTKTTTTKTTSTTTTHTTTCTTSTTCTTTKKNCCCCCSLKGKAEGCVSNQSDEFYCQAAVIMANVQYCSCFKDKILSYTVQNDDDILSLDANANSIKIECPSPLNPDRIVIRGRGLIKKRSECRPDIIGTGSFVLKVWDKKLKKSSFQIVISSDKAELRHDSGLVHTINSSLRIE